MAIQVTCSQCGQTHNVPEKHAGQTGRCTCGATLQVPEVTVPGGLGDLGGLADAPPSGATHEPIEGGIECRACGMTSAPGETCQWCGKPLAARRAETPLPPAGVGAGSYHAPEHSDRGPGAPTPAIVTVVRVLLLISLVLTGLAVPLLFLGGAAAMQRSSFGGNILLLVGSLSVFFLGLYLWLWNFLGKASTAAWWVFTVLTGLYVLFAPIRLLMSISAARSISAAGAHLPPEVQNSPQAAEIMAGVQAGMKVGTSVGLGINVVFLILAIVILVLWLRRDVKRWFGVV